MSRVKVVKFGGTSMADDQNINRSAEIVLSDPERKYVVVSAPGKRFKDDIKVTDLLYRAYEEKAKFGTVGEAFEQIRDRFREISAKLNLDWDADKTLDEVEDGINRSDDPQYAASRGEYLSAIVMAKRLNFTFLDAAEVVKFNRKGAFDAQATNDVLSERLQEISGGAVIPGFYGADPDGNIRTFSRGGSDVSGAIAARAVKAAVYENWTDVNGFMTTDPRIVENPLPIPELSYEELRELSYMGASVLHPESIFPIKDLKMPINIRNTFQPSHPGTMILAEKKPQSDRVVTGIAGTKGNVVLTVEKAMMNAEIGFVRKILTVLEEFSISFEHMPTGIDTMSLVFSGSELKEGAIERLRHVINKRVNPDRITIDEGIALIAVVGEGMANKIGTSAKIFNALADANINIRMIDQGSSEMNVIVGVRDVRYEEAVKVIYQAFFGESQR